MPSILDSLINNQPKENTRLASKLQNMLDPNVVSRGTLLPFGRTKSGDFTMAVPKMGLEIAKAAMLPGHVALGGDFSAKDVTDMAGTINMPSLLRGGASPNTLGMNLYHGGPNKWAAEPGFPQGRPRLDKMGSGEGAQAYGHGFYSAESPKVADTYKQSLTSLAKNLDTTIPADKVVGMLKFQTTIPNIRSLLKRDYPQSSSKEIDDFILQGKEKFNNAGNLYKLDIPDEDVAKYIDWDAPLSAQPDFIKQALSGIMEPNFRVYPKGQKEPVSQKFATQEEADNLLKSFGNDASMFEIKNSGDAASGAEIYRKLIDIHGSPEKASEFLKSVGIPGTRFLDEQSRIGTQSNATRNYVTWDQEVLDRAKVLQRNEEIYKQLEKSGVPFA